MGGTGIEDRQANQQDLQPTRKLYSTKALTKHKGTGTDIKALTTAGPKVQENKGNVKKTKMKHITDITALSQHFGIHGFN